MISVPKKAYADFINRVVDYYGGRTTPTPGAMKEWIAEFARHRIDETKLDAIFHQIKLGKSFPGNFPMAVSEIYRSMAEEESKPSNDGCSECDGGLIFVKRPSEKHPSGWEQAVFRCLRCKTARVAFAGVFAGNLGNDGWIVYDVHNDPQQDEYNRSGNNDGAYFHREAGRLEAERKQMGRGYGYAEARD